MIVIKVPSAMRLINRNIPRKALFFFLGNGIAFSHNGYTETNPNVAKKDIHNPRSDTAYGEIPMMTAIEANKEVTV